MYSSKPTYKIFLESTEITTKNEPDPELNFK